MTPTMRRLIIVPAAILAELVAWHFGAAGHVAPMTILLIEGFDHLGSSGGNGTMTAKGWSTAYNMVTGRFSGQCVQPGTAMATKSFTASSTVIVGFAWKNSSAAAKGTMVAIRAGTTNTLQFQTNASNQIVIKNSSGTTIATGTTVLNASTWYYIEIKCVINGAAGSVTVQLNGVSEIAQTTGNFGSTNVDNIGIVGISAQTTNFDDIYVLDTTGPAPRNTFLGDVRVSTISPNGAGSHAQFTANGAANNWDCVDEQPPDDDTTYVSDATAGDIDTYACSDVDGGATVYAVQVIHYGRKDDAAVRQTAPVIRQGGVDHVGNTVTQGSSYAFTEQIWNQDPSGSDWTAANVNADEFGVEVIA